jgi:flagellar biosynthesis GTPase FlhF
MQANFSRRKSMKKLAIALLAAALPFAAQAQKIYMCKDASGRTLTSDRPIPECADRVTKEMDKGGIVRREILPPLTEQQRLQKQQEEERRKAEAEEAAKQKQADAALMARFRNENDIALAKKRNLDVVQDPIKRETLSLEAAEKERKAAQQEVDKFKGKKVPAGIQRKLDESNQLVADIKKRLEEYQQEAALISGKFDDILKRYRELMGPAPSATPAAATTAPTTAAAGKPPAK